MADYNKELSKDNNLECKVDRGVKIYEPLVVALISKTALKRSFAAVSKPVLITFIGLNSYNIIEKFKQK